MTDSPARLIRDSFALLRGAPVAFALVWVLVEAAAAAAIAPIGSWATNWVIGRSGRYAIANEDIVRFALTPLGFASLLFAATVSVLGVALARAAVMRVAHDGAGDAGDGSTMRPSVRVVRALALAGSRLPTLASLAARQVVLLLLRASPFLIAIVAIAWLTTRNTEVYWLVTARPARFWLALGGVGALALAMALVVAPRWLRWSLALPLCTLEGMRAGEAMRESDRLMRGRLRVAIISRVGWFALVNIASGLALAAVYAGSVALLRREVGSLTLTALLAGVSLLAHGAILFLEAALLGVGDAALVYRMWRGARPEAPGAPRAVGGTGPVARRRGRVALAALLVVAVVVGAASVGFLRSLRRPIEVELTAHRGASLVAPENTLAAIDRAIELGADRIEIDVMLTADGRPILFHDTDLRRMANDRRRVSGMTLEELREIDVGSWFAPEFSSERIPTLDEALDRVALAPRPVTLNIELKTNGDADELARVVAAKLRERGDDTSIVTSLSTRALEAMRREDPGRRIGAIVSASVGDVLRLDVDLFAVPVNRATSAFIAAAGFSDREVHVWTVSDPDLLTRLALRGVGGVMTGDIEGMRRRLDELGELDDLERLLLAFRARLLE